MALVMNRYTYRVWRLCYMDSKYVVSMLPFLPSFLPSSPSPSHIVKSIQKVSLLTHCASFDNDDDDDNK